MLVAYVFPGQGSQFVGMGRDLYQQSPAAKAVFDEADAVLGFSLSRLCFEGPEEELRQTMNVQPAIVVMSLACLVSARDKLPVPAFVVGHSLGEYTALAAAGVIGFADAIRLARERGRLMHEAGLQSPGAMVAVLGMDEDKLAPICAASGVQIANINCPGQLVISGSREGIARASDLAKSAGAKRLVPLAVSGAFHTELMRPAAGGLAQFLDGLVFAEPEVPIVANTTAEPVDSGAALKSELKEQLCRCVRWQRSVEYMVDDGVTTFIEIGPGKVLSGLIKRINPGVETQNIGDAVTINNL
ncbi:MAG: [acyl-carrier-protein] S-malonyltransferase [Dehalococcoidia bacterium]|jgi:[acyl-carrier-protein] S-malonyltransferase|nr:MAG: [acyl-carrier-protein] S-malonyltransferase [Dehalococcoidia bacterium]